MDGGTRFRSKLIKRQCLVRAKITENLESNACQHLERTRHIDEEKNDHS